MNGWAKNLPLVTVPRRDRPKSVTVIYPYYENARFFASQIQGWMAYPDDLTLRMTVLVVDDGSPVPAVLPDERPCQMRLFRIEQDLRWNWIGARNIGFHHAVDGWCVVTDMDHVIPADTMRAVVYGDHDPAVIYGFSRREHTGVSVTPHPNSWLMTREMFWRVGGYDEALSGRYGTDGEWRRRCAAVAPIHILSDVLVRHEFQQDASTTRYQRKQPEDAAVQRIVATRGTGWTPKTLSFPYHEVTPC